jgi:hypothetical protein
MSTPIEGVNDRRTAIVEESIYYRMVRPGVP